MASSGVHSDIDIWIREGEEKKWSKNHYIFINGKELFDISILEYAKINIHYLKKKREYYDKCSKQDMTTIYYKIYSKTK